MQPTFQPPLITGLTGQRACAERQTIIKNGNEGDIDAHFKHPPTSHPTPPKNKKQNIKPFWTNPSVVKRHEI